MKGFQYPGGGGTYNVIATPVNQDFTQLSAVLFFLIFYFFLVWRDKDNMTAAPSSLLPDAWYRYMLATNEIFNLAVQNTGSFLAFFVLFCFLISSRWFQPCILSILWLVYSFGSLTSTCMFCGIRFEAEPPSHNIVLIEVLHGARPVQVTLAKPVQRYLMQMSHLSSLKGF